MFELVDNPPPGESGITNEMREAWRNYKESKEPGIIPWNDFVAEVGGIQKANEIKAQLSRPQQNLSAASSFQKDTDEAGADEYSESSWDDLEFDFETVSENSTPPILGLATVVVVGAILYLEASFTTLGILLNSASLGFHLVALFWV